MTTDEFVTTLHRMVIPSTQANATGLIGPLMRAMGHLLYALAASAATPPTATPEEIKDEINAAAAHLLGTTNISEDCLSNEIIVALDTIQETTNHANVLWDNWEDNVKKENLILLINAYMSVATKLDRELAGITDSDPGSSL
jgi:hypothetical protein